MTNIIDIELLQPRQKQSHNLKMIIIRDAWE